MTSPLSKFKKEKILADYHAGIPQQKIAKKHEVSAGLVNKLCKGIDRKNEQHVNDLSRIALDLSDRNDLELVSIEREVRHRLEDMKLFRAASLLIIKKALNKLDHDDLTMFDLEKAQSVIGKGKENIYGKQADTAVQINNTPTTVTYKWEE